MENNISSIDVWGDGEQTRSFMFIDDCLAGTKKLFKSDCSRSLNIGSEEQVSINQMIDIISEIAGHKVKKNYQLDKPKGVRGRSSDNTLIREQINWDTNYSLKNGLELTYKWIYDQMKNNPPSNTNKFTTSY